MSIQRQVSGGQHSEQAPEFEILEPLRRRLLEGSDVDGYRLLASLFDQLAELSLVGADGRSSQLSRQAQSWAKKVKTLSEERASLQDTLAQTRADLAESAKQLEAVQSKNVELDKIIKGQRSRLDSQTKSNAELEAELVAKNSQLHEAAVATEDLELRAQRAEFAAEDTSQAERLEGNKQDLASEVAALTDEITQLRADKDAEIERMKAQLLTTQGKAAAAGDVVLETLWRRLSKARPPLAEGHIAPTQQAADRLVDAFIALAGFAQRLDEDLRPFLNRYMKHNEMIKRPWRAYQQLERISDRIKCTIAIQGQKAELLKMRLGTLRAWTVAALLAGDTGIESLGSELEGHLLGPTGTGSNPQCKVREYIRAEGPTLFAQRVSEIRSRTLAEAYMRFLRTP